MRDSRSTDQLHRDFIKCGNRSSSQDRHGDCNEYLVHVSMLLRGFGDRAYVVVPVNYRFKKKGALIKEVGSTFTIALQKEKDGWRITGWAWAKR